MHTRILRLIAATALAASLSACQKPLDLSAVRKLHDSAAAAQTSFSALVQDYHDSCVRQNRWLVYLYGEGQQKGANSGVDSDTRRRINAIQDTLHGAGTAPIDPATERRLHDELDQLTRQLATIGLGSASTSASQIKTIYAAQQSCDDQLNTLAMRKWSAWNRLLLGYYVALGDIAGKAPDDSAFGVKDFANALKSDAVLKTDSEVQSVSAFAISAIDAAFAARRSREIANFAGPDKPGTKFVETITDDLKKSATAYIDGKLRPERRTVDVFYTTNIKAVPAGTQVLTGLQGFIKSWDADANAVDTKIGAARAYITALDDMKTSHDAIAAAIASGKTESLGSIVGIYLNEFAPQVEAIRKAFAEKPKS